MMTTTKASKNLGLQMKLEYKRQVVFIFRGVKNV